MLLISFMAYSQLKGVSFMSSASQDFYDSDDNGFDNGRFSRLNKSSINIFVFSFTDSLLVHIINKRRRLTVSNVNKILKVDTEKKENGDIDYTITTESIKSEVMSIYFVKINLNTGFYHVSELYHNDNNEKTFGHSFRDIIPFNIKTYKQ